MNRCWPNGQGCEGCFRQRKQHKQRHGNVRQTGLFLKLQVPSVSLEPRPSQGAARDEMGVSRSWIMGSAEGALGCQLRNLNLIL